MILKLYRWVKSKRSMLQTSKVTKASSSKKKMLRIKNKNLHLNQKQRRINLCPKWRTLAITVNFKIQAQ
jgi:hypothetical protein